MFKKIIVIILIIGLFVSGLWFFSGSIKNIFHFVFSPLERVFYRVGDSASDVVAGFFKAKQIKEEKQEITNKYFGLLSKIADLELLESENEILRQLTKVGLAEEFDLAMVELAAYSADRNSVFITSQPDVRVQKGMPVVTSQAVLVGRVEQVLGSFVCVSLITKPGFIFDTVIHSSSPELKFNESLVLAENSNGILGALEGQGKGQLALGLVPKEKEIKRGDVVLTTTLGGNFPKGLLVGELEELVKTDAEPFYKGTVKPFFTENPLNYLFVITNFEALSALE